jgi:hypothetical protein
VARPRRTLTYERTSDASGDCRRRCWGWEGLRTRTHARLDLPRPGPVVAAVDEYCVSECRSSTHVTPHAYARVTESRTRDSVRDRVRRSRLDVATHTHSHGAPRGTRIFSINFAVSRPNFEKIAVKLLCVAAFDTQLATRKFLENQSPKYREDRALVNCACASAPTITADNAADTHTGD